MKQRQQKQMKKEEYIQIKNKIIHVQKYMNQMILKNIIKQIQYYLQRKKIILKIQIYLYYNIQKVMNYAFLMEK